MTSASSLLRSLVIYSVCLPLAIALGYMVSTPNDPRTSIFVGATLFLLLVPLLLRWHHTWLILTWNVGAVLFFLPGSPTLWMAMVWLSLLIGILQYTLNRRLQFISVPSVARPLIVLTIVVLVTARFTGGIGLQVLGSSNYGGKRYILLLTGIAAYFALTSQPIAPHRALFFIGLYFVGAVSTVISDTVSFVSPNLYYIFLLFPPNDVGVRMSLDPSISQSMARFGCFAAASLAIMWYMLARYGIEGIFSWRRLGRAMIFFVMVFATTLGGFRSMFLLLLLTLATVFVLEGLIHSRMLPALVLGGILGAAGLFAFSTHLPLSVQRTISILPIPVDPIAKASADATWDWRLDLWKRVWPDVPKHLLLGKGLSIDPHELQMLSMATSYDGASYEAELASDYHSGPLSVLMTFGLAGTLAFIWFLIAGLKVLRRNYDHGDPSLLNVNRFLFAFFIAKIIFYFACFGSFYADMATFTGLIGLSVCINNGVAKPARATQPTLVYNRSRLPGALRGPVRV